MHGVSVTMVSTAVIGEVQQPGNSNPDNDFRFDATLGSGGGYIFNLSTNGTMAGTYELNFIVGNDASAVYSAPIQVK